MVAVLLALAAAVGFGVSDFAAGVASRKADVLAVTFLATLCSLVVSAIALPWMAGHAPSVASLAWGAGGGLGGLAGALCLYAGFRRAAFSVAGPLSAVSSAGLSVIAGVALGERPSALSLTGIVVALPAIVLVSLAATSASEGRPADSTPVEATPVETRSADSTPGDVRPAGTAFADAASGAVEFSGAGSVTGSASVRAADAGAASSESTDVRPADADLAGSAPRSAGSSRPGGAWSGVGLGLAAGVGFASLFVGLNRAGSAAGVWPVIAGQVMEAIVMAGVVAGTGWSRARLHGSVALAVLTGVSGGGATILYFVATHKGFLAIAAVLTSLYPAGTIGLARVFASERLSASRLAGLVLAGLSVTLIALGGTG